MSSLAGPAGDASPEQQQQQQQQLRLAPRLGAFSATAIIAGSMIGSGIFIAPSIMAEYVATPGTWLGLWVVGGALTLLGALSYAELCTMMPHAGGQYVFLRSSSCGPGGPTPTAPTGPGDTL